MNGQSKPKATSEPIPMGVAGGKQKQLGTMTMGQSIQATPDLIDANNTELLAFATLAWLAL